MILLPLGLRGCGDDHPIPPRLLAAAAVRQFLFCSRSRRIDAHAPGPVILPSGASTAAPLRTADPALPAPTGTRCQNRNPSKLEILRASSARRGRKSRVARYAPAAAIRHAPTARNATARQRSECRPLGRFRQSLDPHRPADPDLLVEDGPASSRAPCIWQAPPVNTTRRPATRSLPLASIRLRTSSNVSSRRGAMMLTSSDFGM